MAQINPVELRSLHTQRRDLITAMRLASDEQIVEISLQIAAITAMIAGTADVVVAKHPKAKALKINPEIANNVRIRFYYQPVDARDAKEVLKQAFQLDFLPNARIAKGEFEGKMYSSIYYTNFTAAMQLKEQFTDLFFAIESSKPTVE